MPIVYMTLGCLFILVIILWKLSYNHEVLIDFRENIKKGDVVTFREDNKNYVAVVVKIFFYGSIEDSTCQVTVYQEDGDYTKVTSFNNIYPIKEI